MNLAHGIINLNSPLFFSLCPEVDRVNANWLLRAHSQASHHGGRADAPEYAENGEGHPSHDEHDKGEHVGGFFAQSSTSLVIRPVTKYPDVSGDEPTEVEQAAQCRRVFACILLNPCPTLDNHSHQCKDSGDLKNKGFIISQL